MKAEGEREARVSSSLCGPMLREGESIIQLKSYSAEGKRKEGEGERQMEKDTTEVFTLREGACRPTRQNCPWEHLSRSRPGERKEEEEERSKLGPIKRAEKEGSLKGSLECCLARPRWAKK